MESIGHTSDSTQTFQQAQGAILSQSGQHTHDVGMSRFSSTDNNAIEYQRALKDLREHLSGLSNPHTVNKIAAIFASIHREPLDSRHGFLDKFPPNALPPTTYNFLSAYNSQVKQLCRGILDTNRLLKTHESVREDIESLSKLQPKDHLWPSMTDFLELEAVQRWDNNRIRELIRLASEGAKEDLLSYAQSLSELAPLLEELRRKERPQLRVVLAQVFFERPSRPEAIVRATDVVTLRETEDAFEYEFHKIVQSLMRDSALLDKILDSLLKHNFEKVDVDLYQPLSTTLISLSQLHLPCQEPISPHQLLKQAAIQALCNKMAPEGTGRTPVIENAMELLRQSYTHIEAMKGSVVLFMGPTNSGKSSAIAFFQGAEFQPVTNEIGKQTYIIADTNRARFPTVGRGLGISQTVCAQSWNVDVKGIPVPFVDGPGEDDTRGDAHALFANLNLDLTVGREEGDVGVLVLTIPYSALDESNGQAALRLLRLVKQRFPACFDLEQSHYRRVYVLITKCSHIRAPELDAFKSGKRFRTYIAEMENELKKQESEPGRADATLRENSSFWKYLSHLQKNHQMRLFDLDNESERASILQEITSRLRGKGLKGCYVSAMRTAAMQKQFGDILQPSADAWSGILKSYTYVKKDIEASEQKIHNAEEQQRELQCTIDERAADMERCFQEIERITRARHVLENRHQFSDIPQEYDERLPGLVSLRKRESASIREEGDTLPIVILPYIFATVIVLSAVTYVVGFERIFELAGSIEKQEREREFLVEQVDQVLKEDSQELVMQKVKYEQKKGQQALGKRDLHTILNVLNRDRQAREGKLRIKRQLAICIYTRAETIRALKKFVDVACSHLATFTNTEQSWLSLQRSYHHFQQVYQSDVQFEGILRECKQFLGLRDYERL